MREVQWASLLEFNAAQSSCTSLRERDADNDARQTHISRTTACFRSYCGSPAAYAEDEPFRVIRGNLASRTGSRASRLLECCMPTGLRQSRLTNEFITNQTSELANVRSLMTSPPGREMQFALWPRLLHDNCAPVFRWMAPASRTSETVGYVMQSHSRSAPPQRLSACNTKAQEKHEEEPFALSCKSTCPAIYEVESHHSLAIGNRDAPWRRIIGFNGGGYGSLMTSSRIGTRTITAVPCGQHPHRSISGCILRHSPMLDLSSFMRARQRGMRLTCS